MGAIAGDAQQDFFYARRIVAPPAQILLFLLPEAIQWLRLCGRQTTDTGGRFAVAEVGKRTHFDEQGLDGA